MPATEYKIWQMGPAVGEGATSPYHVGVHGIAKAAAAAHPFAVVNEVICGDLARALSLPIPPGFIIRHENTPYHVSLNFNLAGEDLPPADVARLVANHPNLACGIVLFDIWILNADRHRKNLAYDTNRNEVQIFDHSHALFTGTNGRQQLETRRDALAIGNGHCLAGELTCAEGLSFWNDRINSIPDYYIRQVVRDTCKLGLSEPDAAFCVSFLLDRRNRLLDLVNGNRNAFPRIEARLWDGWEG